MNATVFAIMPFSESFDEYYQKIISPAIESIGRTPVRADQIYGDKPIIEDIFNEINASDCVIADVTSKNPNVNYELGYAHALGKPAIIITQSMDDVPFDYRHRRCIVYDTTKVQWDVELGKTLTRNMRAAISQSSPIWTPSSRVSEPKQPHYPNSYFSFTSDPALAVYRDEDAFVLIATRKGDVSIGYLEFLEVSLDTTAEVNDEMPSGESLHLRGVYYDEKHGNLIVHVDHFYETADEPRTTKSELLKMFHHDEVWESGVYAYVSIRQFKVWRASDNFFANSSEYYSSLELGSIAEDVPDNSKR